MNTTTTMITPTEIVEKQANTLCETLKANFIDYSIRQHERSIDYADAGNVSSVRYHERCIDKLRDGESDYDFTIDTGRKYHKVIMNAHGNRSVHAFIDKKTGEVYKAASWKAPAKGVRFNLLIINSREECFQRADWAGSYLYAR